MLPSYTPETIDFSPARTFQAWLTRLQGQLPRYFDRLRTYFNTDLLPSLNTNLYGLGPDIASATTIYPTNYVHKVTGSSNVQNINAPTNFAGSIVLIASAGFSTLNTGNILLAVTINANHAGLFTYHGALQAWSVITS